MRRIFLSLLSLAVLAAPALALEFEAVPNLFKLQPGRSQFGNQHGDIAVSSAGEIYVSMMDPKAGIQVYAPDGTWLRNVPNAPNDFHGFVIRQSADGEFIYGPRLGAGNILKLTLDGKEVLNIPPTAIPDEFKGKDKDGKPIVRLTGMDVAPNGDLYVTDGYSGDYVHHFDKTGKYLNSFGGKKEPYNFKTLHKIAIDTRFDPPRIIACDRGNNRMVHMALNGDFLGVVATDLRSPSAVAVQGEYAVIGELKGRVAILDKAGKIVTTFGTNETPDEIGTNKTEPDKWKPGIINAAHGVVFDAKGNVLVSEWSLYGRMHFFARK